MDRIEWNHSADSVHDYEAEPQGTAEVALPPAAPILDQLVQKVELPSDFKEMHTPDAEAVISKVVEVAENNRTNERLLERKHEVKDFAGSRSQKMQYAARVGELLESKKQNLSNYNLAASSTASSQKANPLQQLLNSNSLYGYAIKYGFISALMALTVAIFLVILIK